MKNIKISLLATLMLMGLGLFSTTTFAFLDCESLSVQSVPGISGTQRSHCESHRNTYGDRTWKDPFSNVSRIPNQDYGKAFQIQNDYIDSLIRGGSSQQQVPVQKVEKTFMSMDEIRAYKFDKALNGYRTTEKDLIAKTLIEKYDLWAVYSKGGGAGIRAKMIELGLGGHSKTNYRPHSGNIFVYIHNNFSALEIMQKANISDEDFSQMGVKFSDVINAKISPRDFSIAYFSLLKKRGVNQKYASL